jgi:hypothetical protein
LDYLEILQAQYKLCSRLNLGNIDKMSYLEFLYMNEFLVNDTQKPSADVMKDLLKNANR